MYIICQYVYIYTRVHIHILLTKYTEYLKSLPNTGQLAWRNFGTLISSEGRRKEEQTTLV